MSVILHTASHSVLFHTQCVFLQKVCNFTHCDGNLCYFVARQFVSQIYAVLSRGNFCYALFSVKFSGLIICECKKMTISGMRIARTPSRRPNEYDMMR